MRGFRRLLLGALLTAPFAASAAEIVGETPQVNPKSDAAKSINTANVLRDENGGFAVVWAKNTKDPPEVPDQLFARFFKATAKPDGKALRFDGKVGGKTPDGVGLHGGATLGAGKLFAVWSARFNGVLSADGYGQFFEDQKLSGKAKSVEPDKQVNMSSPVQLSDGGALILWLKDGDFSTQVGRFVRPNGSLGPDNLSFTVGAGSFFPVLYPLDRGVVAVASRQAGSSFEVAAQVYNEKGRKEGKSFVLIPDTSTGIGGYHAAGLLSGEVALLKCELNEPLNPFVCDVTAQLLDRKGKEIGAKATLVKGAATQTPVAIATEKPGFLLILEEGETESKNLAFRRVDDRLKVVGAVARTKARTGLRRGAARRIGNGRIAAISIVDGAAMFVSVIEP